MSPRPWTSVEAGGVFPQAKGSLPRPRQPLQSVGHGLGWGWCAGLRPGSPGAGRAGGGREGAGLRGQSGRYLEAQAQGRPSVVSKHP